LGGLLKARGAVSPVISTLIIVATVFAMFALIYPWAMSSLTLSQSSADIWYSSQEKASRERVSVEMVVFRVNESGKYVDVYVRNVGEVDVEVSAIYINGSPQVAVTPPLPKRLYVGVDGGESTACFTVTYPWSVGGTYRVKVVTGRGSEAVYEARR
jgi:archaellum component FlaF (FlaF/FlaG flagellin family)